MSEHEDGKPAKGDEGRGPEGGGSASAKRAEPGCRHGASGEQQGRGPGAGAPGEPATGAGPGGPAPGWGPAMYGAPYGAGPWQAPYGMPGMGPQGPGPGAGGYAPPGYPPPGHPYHGCPQPGMHPGMFPPGMAGMPPGAPGFYGPPPGMSPGTGAGGGAGAGPGPGMAEVVEEIANGGSGLASLGKLLDLDDGDFWKGALVGAAAVLLLTNESVQKTLFKTGVKAKDGLQHGVERVKKASAGAKAEAAGAEPDAAED